MITDLLNMIQNVITSTTAWLNTVSGGNDFLAGTLAVSLTSVLVIGRSIPMKVYKWVKARVFTSRTLHSDSLFTKYYENNYIPAIIITHNESWWFKLVRSSELSSVNIGTVVKEIRVPTNGTYLLFHNWRLFFITYEASVKVSPGDNKPRELKLTVKTLGFKYKPLDNLIESSYEKEITSLKEVSSLKKYISTDNWFTVEPRKNVTNMDFSYIPQSQKEEIVEVVDKILRSKEWFRSKGLVYKESIMLEGPPGTGKSNIIRFLTDHFRLPVFYISCSDLEASSKKLFAAIKEITTMNDLGLVAVVIEDFDSLSVAKDRNIKSTVEREMSDMSSKLSGFTQSDFLNMLDGNNCVEDVLYIFTTNYPEKIDEAVKRPGRVNHTFRIDYMETPEIVGFIQRNFENVSIPTDEWRMTIAELQLIYNTHHDDYKAFLKELDKFKKEM